jgi:hypothetical protein
VLKSQTALSQRKVVAMHLRCPREKVAL